MDRYYFAALQQVKGLGNAQLARLMTAFPRADDIGKAGEGELIGAGLTAKVAAEIIRWRRDNPHAPAKLQEECERKRIGIVTLQDDNYPAMLREIHSPPAVLYCRGELRRDELCLAMVGSRRATPYGRNVAEAFARDLARCGLTVVSGAARGIDTSSHVGALKNGRTIAVLGCGVDVIYPPENGRLLAAIAEQGAVISELMPGTPPYAAHFPARNRIISGMSRGVMVVEAAKRSGALITAELARSENRDIFAVPGSVFSEASSGCHYLIQQGAKLVTDAQDVLDEFSVDYMNHGVKAPPPDGADDANGLDLTDEEAVIYEILSFDKPLSMDEVIYALHGGDAASNVSFLLLQMEIKGAVIENESHEYLRAPRE